MLILLWRGRTPTTLRTKGKQDLDRQGEVNIPATGQTICSDEYHEAVSALYVHVHVLWHSSRGMLSCLVLAWSDVFLLEFWDKLRAAPARRAGRHMNEGAAMFRSKFMCSVGGRPFVERRASTATRSSRTPNNVTFTDVMM